VVSTTRRRLGRAGDDPERRIEAGIGDLARSPLGGVVPRMRERLLDAGVDVRVVGAGRNGFAVMAPGHAVSARLEQRRGGRVEVEHRIFQHHRASAAAA
jgi:hypothetical protein